MLRCWATCVFYMILDSTSKTRLERDFFDSVLSIFKRFVYSDIFDIRKPKQQRI